MPWWYNQIMEAMERRRLEWGLYVMMGQLYEIRARLALYVMMGQLYENRAWREWNENRAQRRLNAIRAQRPLNENRAQRRLNEIRAQRLNENRAQRRLNEIRAQRLNENRAQRRLNEIRAQRLNENRAQRRLNEIRAQRLNENRAQRRWNEIKAQRLNENRAQRRLNEIRAHRQFIEALRLAEIRAQRPLMVQLDEIRARRALMVQLYETMAWKYIEMRAWFYEIRAWFYEMRAWLYNEMMGQLSWQQPADVFSWLRFCSADIEEDFTGYEDLADADVTRWSNEISMPYNGIQMSAPRVFYTKRTIDVLFSYYVGIHGIIFAVLFSVKAMWWGWAFLVLVSAFILTRVLYPIHIIYKLLSYYMGTYGMIFAAIFSLLIINIKMLGAIWWTFPILTAMISAIVINLFRHRTACTDLRHYIHQLNMSRDKLKKSPEGISLSGRHPRFHSSLLRSSKRAIIKGETILRNAGTVEDDEPIDLDEIDPEVEWIADDNEFLEPQDDDEFPE